MTERPASSYVYTYSPCLQRWLSGLTDTAIAYLGPGGRILGTRPTAQAGLRRGLQLRKSDPVDASRLIVDVAEPTGGMTVALAPFLPAESGGRRWHVATCRFACGVTDWLTLLLPETPPAKLAYALQAIWPLARDECVGEGPRAPAPRLTAALAWHLERRDDVAVMVIDRRARLQFADAAAERLLEARAVLGIDQVGRLHPVRHDAALIATAARELRHGETEDCVLLLDGEAPGESLPLTLSLFPEDRGGPALVVATAPLPPRPEQVEAVARARGLTPAEARVAAALQQGLSNREAACAVGIKEKTLETYAKRVNAKLAITRGRLIQELTWQARSAPLETEEALESDVAEVEPEASL